MTIECEYCNKEFKYEYLLKRHIENKLPCIKIKPKCDKCNRFFANNSNLKRHQKNKKDCSMIIKNKHTNQKLEYMKQMINGNYSTNNLTNNNSTNNTTDNSTNNINVHFHIGADSVLPFGKEDTSMISKDMIYHILKFSAMPVM